MELLQIFFFFSFTSVSDDRSSNIKKKKNLLRSQRSRTTKSREQSTTRPWHGVVEYTNRIGKKKKKQSFRCHLFTNANHNRVRRVCARLTAVFDANKLYSIYNINIYVYIGTRQYSSQLRFTFTAHFLRCPVGEGGGRRNIFI